ncbi:MAG: tail fiber domain-containing protein [Magnetococcales bacterium]|nr:tail fiber domain-containing protein [Magnetococcales bacterium]
MGLKLADLAYTTLASACSAGDSALSVVNATLFPTLSGADFTYLTLLSITDAGREVVKATAISGGVITVVRAQGGTVARAFGVGTRVELRLCSAIMEALLLSADHGVLTGLTDDDHPQYLRKDGTLTITHLGSITATALAAMTTTALGGLTSTQLGALNPSAFAGITPSQMAAMTTTALGGLTAAQRGSLVATPALPGMVPAPGTPSQKFLRDDLTWGSAGATNIDGLSDARLLGSSLYLGSRPPNLSGTPSGNVGFGVGCFPMLTTGNYNVMFGHASCLGAVTTGSYNVAGGYLSAAAVTVNGNNVAFGYRAFERGTGTGNIALGQFSLNAPGAYNYSVAIGLSAGEYCTGGDNVMIGRGSGVGGGARNIIVGQASGSANCSGDDNVVLGYASANNMTSASGNIVIGANVNTSAATASNEINIGKIFYATGAYGSTARKAGIGVQAPAAQWDVDTGGNVTAIRADRATTTPTDHIIDMVSNVGGTNTTVAYVEADGTWVEVSDARLKTNITPATPKTDDLLRLNVVNFNWVSDPDGKKCLGLIAQEVQSIFPSMVRESPAHFETIKDPDWVPSWELCLARKINDQENGENRLETIEEIEARLKEMRPTIRVQAGDPRLALSYDAFIPMLIKGFQEMAYRIARLERLLDGGVG